MRTADARELARHLVGTLRPRWSHVAAVGRLAEYLAESNTVVDEALVMAAWLHDIGYSPGLRHMGQHSIDGAAFLHAQGWCEGVVRLVAHHTGAAAEAVERGLAEDLALFDPPDAQALDILTMIDLSVGPDGSSVMDRQRIAEILNRYSDEDPVHLAVTRSQHDLLVSSARAKRLLGLPDDWPVMAC